MTRTSSVVTLEVAKQGAIYHGLATLLNQPSPMMQRRKHRQGGWGVSPVDDGQQQACWLLLMGQAPYEQDLSCPVLERRRPGWPCRSQNSDVDCEPQRSSSGSVPSALPPSQARRRGPVSVSDGRGPVLLADAGCSLRAGRPPPGVPVRGGASRAACWYRTRCCQV